MSHVVVIGGGLAGPLAAVALRRAGYEVSLYEAQAEGAGEFAGAWMTVAVNGLEAMRGLGLHREVMACGFPSQEMEIVTGQEKVLGRIPIGGVLEDGTVTHTMKRAALYQCLLRAAVEAGAAVHFEKALTGLQQDAAQVVASFADGTEARGAILIGADGVHSRVRRLLDPGHPGPRYNGLGNVGGFCPAGEVALAPKTYRLVFGRRCFFGYTTTPRGEVWWFANPPRPVPYTRDELRATGSEGWRALLLGLSSEDRGPVRALIERTPGPLVGTNQYDLPRVARWQEGRVLLIGDAAHAAAPSSGQGASMAAEDALTLAKVLEGARDLPAALSAFVAARRERAERVVAYGARYSGYKAVGPVGRWFRDLLMPSILERQARKTQALAWLFQHRIDWPAPPTA